MPRMSRRRKMKIPFFNYPRVFLDERESLLSILDEVGSRGAFIMQQDVNNFETSLAAYTGSKHSVAVANGTDGLELAWMSIGLRPGDEVIICSHTMLATAPLPVSMRSSSTNCGTCVVLPHPVSPQTMTTL